MALDPTNQQQVGEQHVTIGRGRDYDDVAPFRGVFSGASEHQLEVSVAMRRLAVEPLDSPAGLTASPASGWRSSSERPARGQASAA
jgi:transglutaminase-like putative cysteine protease